MTPAQTLGELFTSKHLTLSTAESCTGGLLAGRIIDVPGSSRYYLGGTVSYANEAKVIQLGVEAGAIQQHGAVSEVVAIQMARGIRERLGTDVAISITGIAGPEGGSPGRPVGLTWFGLCDAGSGQAVRMVWESDRAGNREQSVQHALQMLITWAEQQTTRP